MTASSDRYTATNAPQASVRVRRGIALGRSLRAVHVAAVAVIAVGIELAAAASTRGPRADASWLPIALAVGVFALAAFLRPLEPARGEKFSLAAAAAFFGALVLPGALAVAAVGVASAMAKIVQRRSPLSIAVNVAQAAGATGAASLVAAGGGDVGVIGGGAAYAAVTLASVGVMIAASQGPLAMLGFLRREALPTLALVAVGGIASIVWWHEPLILLLFLPILATIEIASRRAAAEHEALAVRERAERAQREFALDAAHELRTPLTSVIGELDFLRGLDLRATEAAALAAAGSEARRAAGIVERLLLLARTGSEVDLSSADIAEAARRVVARGAGTSRVPIELAALPDALPVPVPGDLLEVLVGDLVQNATAYTREGRVAVSLRRAGPWVELAVADTGVGIAPEELSRVFDRFYRGARARSMSPGTGLGLAIVRRIVETHGGDIAIASTAGTGTTVTVRLPAA
ncbi:MAG: HAMP domain-containing histidine kinase [Chloroflexota bacterium]|nr:HAMP domain-containing histidine kinase [Chloroflexota bacterium]MDE3193872.1 HAMP domain-containing histidine kinase [Chloroflexota bacterium]